MRCPYCDAENVEDAESCRECGQILTETRPRRNESPTGGSKARTPEQVATAHDEWDPAKRFDGTRPASAFVPPARYPTHMTWIISILVAGIPATAIHLVLFYRGIDYPYGLEAAVLVILAACLPLSILALLLAGVLRLRHRAGNAASAYRYSQSIALLCWISIVAALALYVILFLRLMSSVGEFWVP